MEHLETNGPHPWLSVSRVGFHMVWRLFFSSWPRTENMLAHSNGGKLFNARTEGRAGPEPHEPPDEGSRSTAKRKGRLKGKNSHIKYGWGCHSWKSGNFYFQRRGVMRTIFPSLTSPVLCSSVGMSSMYQAVSVVK